MELEPADGFDDLHLVATDDGVLGNGTSGEVRLGVCQGQRVAVKSCSHGSSTAPEVPHHPGLVTVISRRVENGRTIEIRELCGQGELFDVVAEEGGMGEGENVAAAERWVWQIAETVAHCHSHGAANGQLRPEHVLLADVEPKLLGFTSCLPPAPEGVSSLPEGLRSLRPVRALDAPELHGQQSASFSTRAAADVWALGVLIVFIFSAEPPFLSSAPGGCGPTRTPAPRRGRGHGREQPGP
jgi:serine/threonine protein kinase